MTLDRGPVSLYGSKNETTSQGLDELDQRCQQYYKDGLRFAKFRAVFTIDTEKGVCTYYDWFTILTFAPLIGCSGLRF